MTQVPNRPTVLGRSLGKQIARMADKADAEMRAKWPEIAERCTSCAFRGGTLPNGCEETLMDAMKCVMECHPFLCHEDKSENKRLCAGWYVAQAAVLGKEKIPTPWKFSHEYEAEESSGLPQEGHQK